MTFEGISGSSYTGDLAIDDVSISSGRCFSQTVAPPTFPTGAPSASSSLPLNVTSSPTDEPSVPPTPATKTVTPPAFPTGATSASSSLPLNSTSSPTSEPSVPPTAATYDPSSGLPSRFPSNATISSNHRPSAPPTSLPGIVYSSLLLHNYIYVCGDLSVMESLFLDCFC